MESVYKFKRVLGSRGLAPMESYSEQALGVVRSIEGARTVFGKLISFASSTDGLYAVTISGGPAFPPDHYLERGDVIYDDNPSWLKVFPLSDFPQTIYIADDIEVTEETNLIDRMRLFLSQHCAVNATSIQMERGDGSELFHGSIGAIPFVYRRVVEVGGYRFDFPFVDSSSELNARKLSELFSANLVTRVREVESQLSAPHAYYELTCSANSERQGSWRPGSDNGGGS